MNEGTVEADMVWDDCAIPVPRGNLRVRVRDG